ncbi:MAG: hypothetical protein IJM87_02780 [Ruminococcus sp.]|nr:hypothetical protein [Ruminococcus sp.]
MNQAERYMIERLMGAEFEAQRESVFGAAESCQRKNNRRRDTAVSNNRATRIIASYRRAKAGKKRLDIKIRERLAFFERARAECLAAPGWFRLHREKNALLEMIAESARLGKRIELCEKLAEMTEGIVREAIEERYLKDGVKTMPDWPQTAQAVGFEGSGDELCRRVNEQLLEASKRLEEEM